MNMEFEEKDNVLLVRLDGRLVANTAEGLEEAIEDRFKGCRNILIDCSRMDHIDSSGIGSLVIILQKMRAGGGTVKLAALCPRVRIIFDITKVYRVFEIFDNVDEALASFSRE